MRIVQNSILYFLLLLFGYAQAEPYFAARTGHRCMVCHVSPTGGGMRTEFGQIYGRSLAAENPSASAFNASISKNLRMGGDFRGGLQASSIPGEDDQNEIDTRRANIYIHAQLLENLSLYVDQQFAPANENRAAWVKYQSKDAAQYLRVGQFYLPYGVRLEDDTAFIRQVTGVNFATADNSIEFGWDKHNWSTQLAISNGTAGATENNTEKQISYRLAYIDTIWRAGFSLNDNKGLNSERQMFNIFATLNLLDSEWIFEVDRIKDTETSTTEGLITFFEFNKEIIKGHNLKLSFEFYDPDIDIDEDERTRNSIAWEYFPAPQIQFRTGFRDGEGIPQRTIDNLNEIFVNLHAWF